MHLNRKAYLHNQRIAIIQKANVPLQLRIQIINNEAIDERILEYYGLLDKMDNPTSPSHKDEKLTSSINYWNLLATTQDFQRLAGHRSVRSDSVAKLEQMNASRQISDKITKLEVERVNKNLAFVDKVLDEVDLNVEMYNHLREKLPAKMSRLELLEESLESGISIRGSREFSYRELEQLSRDLEKFKTHNVDYEQALIENRQASREGLPPVWTKKVWIWSGAKKTRHRGMSGYETESLVEKFQVKNDITGVVDELRFPHDVENDSNGCANLCNCRCAYEIQ